MAPGLTTLPSTANTTTTTSDAPLKTTSQAKGLTPDQVAFYHDNGYLIIRNALDADTVASLLSASQRLIRDFDPSEHPMTAFRTSDSPEQKRLGSEYFLNSTEKCRFFYEEDAIDAQGKLTKPKHLSINKVGHGLHRDPSLPFQTSTHSATNKGIASSLNYANPLVLQSMIICKQPQIGAVVPPHADGCFLYTDPPSALGYWYALERATRSNGCLAFVPGSHTWNGIDTRWVRRGGEMNWVDVPREHQFASDVKDRQREGREVNEEDFVYEEVEPGDLVLIHSQVLHKSARNLSERSRYIFTFHVAEGAGSGVAKDNWFWPRDGEGREMDEGGFWEL